MSDYTKTNIGSGYNTSTALNAELDKVETATNSKLDKTGGTLSGDLDMNSNDILNISDVFANNIYIDGGLITPVGAFDLVIPTNTILSGQFIATASQTVFTVPSYTVGTNTIFLYVQGVYQSVVDDYVETNTTTVTFNTGITVGDTVEYVINQVASTTAVVGGANLIEYTANLAGGTKRFLQAKLEDAVSVKDFGAVGDGVTDDLVAFQAAFTASSSVVIPKGSYYLNGQISKAADNINVEATGAILIFDGAATGFSFGSSATDSLPNHKGLTWRGGTFRNADGTDVIDRQYLQLIGIEKFHISDVILEEASNGGIHCRSGCRDGLIENIDIQSFSSNTTLRGVWLNGSDATDYAAQLVDLSTIARNATAVPIGGIRNVTIRNVTWEDSSSYGIYLHNAQDTIIEGCRLNASTGGLRCITVNTYSPRTIIRNNHISSSAAASNNGIFLTQFSHDCLIEGNTFTGDFGLAFPLSIIYLATANVVNNKFLGAEPVRIAMYMGGSGRIAGNTFYADTPVGNDRCVRFYTIGSTEATLAGYGDTAGILDGLIFENNDIKTQNMGVQVTQQTSTGANEAGIDSIIVRNNIFRNWANASGSQEYPLYLASIASPANAVHYQAINNTVFPSTSVYLAKNRSEDVGGITGVDIGSTNQSEERGTGTWTIDVTDGTTSATLSTNAGTWARIGNVCHFQAYFIVSSIAGMTGANGVNIEGLPFTAKNTANAHTAMSVGYAAGLAITANQSLSGWVLANTSEGRILIWDATTGTSALTVTELSATGSIAFSGSYIIETV